MSPRDGIVAHEQEQVHFSFAKLSRLFSTTSKHWFDVFEPLVLDPVHCPMSNSLRVALCAFVLSYSRHIGEEDFRWTSPVLTLDQLLYAIMAVPVSLHRGGSLARARLFKPRKSSRHICKESA